MIATIYEALAQCRSCGYSEALDVDPRTQVLSLTARFRQDGAGAGPQLRHRAVVGECDGKVRLWSTIPGLRVRC